LKKEDDSWTMCLVCQGRGKKSKGLRKKVKLRYLRELEQFEKSNGEGIAPVRPKGHLDICVNCKGLGLVHSTTQTTSDKTPATTDYPHIAIVGGGIGGVALAVACLHRGIPFTLYERDSGFDVRSQGYGLTLQQASRAIEGLGILSLEHGLVSTRHVVHTTEGKQIGEWGIRKWVPAGSKSTVEATAKSTAETAPKRTNIHIARQSLRLALLEQLGGHDAVQWGHQLVDFKDRDHGGVELSFQVEDEDDEGEEKGELKHARADTVRRLLIGDDVSPLRYLGCIVILGICPLADLDQTLLGSLSASLLDGATVFQTANGHERMYMMPYASGSVMWQLSFPMPEEEAKALSAQGAQALKDEACRRCQWHEPIPQIIAATVAAQVSGYPAYDREILVPELLSKGDAAHPMSPFKGQGANQALLDALALARGITKDCGSFSQWRETGVRASMLTEFEVEMLERSATKVKGSAEAAEFLHSDIVLHEGDEPRGRVLQRHLIE
jgi:salicylate hydroxylase